MSIVERSSNQNNQWRSLMQMYIQYTKVSKISIAFIFIILYYYLLYLHYREPLNSTVLTFITKRHTDKKSRYIDVFCVSRQHLIYSITPDSGPSQLSVILSVSSTMSSNARLWNIRIYQVNTKQRWMLSAIFIICSFMVC